MMTPREELLEMLTYRRPAGCKAERKFINRFIRPLKVVEDAAGNLIKQVGTSKVLWSSHTDTVHRQGGRQAVRTTADDMAVTASKQDCLGADCTTGVWLMVNMIRANVPGLYIFHRAEEIGGVGSGFISSDTPELLVGIKTAIAFDRKGVTSIVTHQWGDRCCSEKFSSSLSKAIGLPLKSDDGGTFTDTASYTEQISECTNISVGYYNQHQHTEWQDLRFADQLLERMLQFDESLLEFHRTPGEKTRWSYYDSRDDGRAYGSDTFSYLDHSNDEYEDEFDRVPAKRRLLDNLTAVVKANPRAVARLLSQYGITEDDIWVETNSDMPFAQVS